MTKPYTIIRRFLFEFGMISLDRNYQEVINLLFVLPSGLYLSILKTEENIAILGEKILDVRGTSF